MLEIRKIKDNDLKSVLDIAVKAFTPIHESFRVLLGTLVFKMVYPNWIESQNNYIKGLFLDHNKDNFFVVEKDGKIVAFISLLIEEGKDKAEIGINAVNPEHSGQGVGMQMYDYALNYMKGKGIKLVEVSTGGDDSHAVARKAYKKAVYWECLEFCVNKS